MANKRVFKVATASAVAASALVAAVPASAASVTYEQAEKQVNVAREAANGLHAEYTKNADYKTKVDIKEANDELNRAKAKIAALSDAKQKAYLSSRIQGTIDTVARANAYNNAVRVGTEILPAAHQAVVKAADVASLKEGNVLLAEKIKQAKETFPKVYGKEIQAKFASLYLTADLEADRKDGHYAAITADRVAEGLKLIAAGKVEEAEVQYKNAEASFKAVKGLATIKEIIAADWTELGKKIEAAKVAKVESVSAITSKSLKVTFNKAVDTTKATFEVKKDGVKINTSAITFNEAKTEATVELTSKVTKGEYTVNISGLGEKTLTGSVVAQDEKVAKIEVLSNEVPLVDADSDSAADDLKVAYKVTNQYGEDITKTASVVASSGSVDPSKGLVTFTGNYDTTTNKTVAFTLINVESNVSTSSVVTAVSAATDSSVEIKGIYNKDGKTLTETTDLTKDKFFLEIEVKDQYGNVVKSPAANKILVSETNNTIVDVDDSSQTPALDTTTVDGKVLIAINAPVAGIKAGESTITLINKNTGKSSSATVKVAEGVRANSVTLGQPALVAQGEDALIPVTVLDKDGNEIKDLNILNSSTRGLNVGANTLVKKNDMIYLKVTTPAVGPNVAMVTVIPSQKIVTTNYTVRDAATPAVITGLDSAVQKSISNGLTQKIKGQDLVIEDQYGRVMTDAAVNTWLTVANNSIVLTSSKESTDNSPFTVTTNAVGSTDNAKQVITASTDEFILTAKAVAGLNSTERMTLALSTDAGATSLASTSKDVVFTKVGVTDFASYEISAPSTIYNEDNSEFSFKVYGVKADGSKTLLKDDQYNLVASSDFGVASGAVNSNTLELTTALTTIDNDDTTAALPLSVDKTFKVVINNDAATTVEKVVKVSAEDRKVTSFAVSTDGTSEGDALSSLAFEASTSSDDTAVMDLSSITSDAGTLDITALEQNLYYVDQYGKETAAALGNVYLTFSSLVDEDTTKAAAINANGSTTASVTDLEAGDTVKVKIETAGLAAQTFAVTIK